jgi:hypothetical protein
MARFVLKVEQRLINNVERNTFVETCFVVSDRCGSGHVVKAHGWMFDLCFNRHDVMKCFSPDVRVGWYDDRSNKAYYQTFGLCRGTYGALITEQATVGVDGVVSTTRLKTPYNMLIPEFDSTSFEIHDTSLWEKLSKKTKPQA